MLNGDFSFYKSGNKFYGMDKSGNKIAELSLIAQTFYAEETNLQLSLKYSNETALTRNDTLKIYIADDEYPFMPSVKYTIHKNEDNDLSYKMIWDKRIIDKSITKVELPLKNVVQWIKAE